MSFRHFFANNIIWKTRATIDIQTKIHLNQPNVKNPPIFCTFQLMIPIFFIDLWRHRIRYFFVSKNFKKSNLKTAKIEKWKLKSQNLKVKTWRWVKIRDALKNSVRSAFGLVRVWSGPKLVRSGFGLVRNWSGPKLVRSNNRYNGRHNNLFLSTKKKRINQRKPKMEIQLQL